MFGWFAFRSRVTGVYLSIITQAMTFALMLGFFRNNFGFGGNNGLTDFKDILGFNVQARGDARALFAISCVALVLGFLICRAIVTSKFGKVLVAIRDAEARTRFLGYRVEAYKLFVFTLSACMAGVAGALYVPQVGIINPSEFAPGNSIEAVIWVAVGGRGTLIGAVLGAVRRQLRQDLSSPPACSRPTGCSCWAACSSRSRCCCRAASSARCSIGARGAARTQAVGGAGRRAAAGGVSVDGTANHLRAALSRRRHGVVRRLRALNICRSSSSRARCAPSSARTAPARPR